MRVHEDLTELADGTPGLYGWIEKRPGIVDRAASTTTTCGSSSSIRHLVGERLWEFPQGRLGGRRDSTPRSSRAMELAEETGLRAGAAATHARTRSTSPTG